MKRRSFLKKSAAVSAGTLAAGAVAACSPSPVDPNSGSIKSAASIPKNQRSSELKMVTTWPKLSWLRDKGR